MFLYAFVVVAIVSVSSYILYRNKLLNVNTILAMAMASIVISFLFPLVLGGITVFPSDTGDNAMFSFGILVAVVITFMIYLVSILFITILISCFVSEKKAEKLWKSVASASAGGMRFVFADRAGWLIEEVKTRWAALQKKDMDETEEAGKNILEKSVDTVENIDTMGIENVAAPGAVYVENQLSVEDPAEQPQKTALDSGTPEVLSAVEAQRATASLTQADSLFAAYESEKDYYENDITAEELTEQPLLQEMEAGAEEMAAADASSFLDVYLRTEDDPGAAEEMEDTGETEEIKPAEAAEEIENATVADEADAEEEIEDAVAADGEEETAPAEENPQTEYGAGEAIAEEEIKDAAATEEAEVEEETGHTEENPQTEQGAEEAITTEEIEEAAAADEPEIEEETGYTEEKPEIEQKTEKSDEEAVEAEAGAAKEEAEESIEAADETADEANTEESEDLYAPEIPDTTGTREAVEEPAPVAVEREEETGGSMEAAGRAADSGLTQEASGVPEDVEGRAEETGETADREKSDAAVDWEDTITQTEEITGEARIGENIEKLPEEMDTFGAAVLDGADPAGPAQADETGAGGKETAVRQEPIQVREVERPEGKAEGGYAAAAGDIFAIDDCINEAFRLKGNGDMEGAILHYMYALDKSPGNDLVFWIILDICVLYKSLGQAELAKDILQSYQRGYAEIMDEGVRAEIEKNLLE